MLLTGIGMMGYKLVVTQFAQSTRNFATLHTMRPELQLPLVYTYTSIVGTHSAHTTNTHTHTHC